MRYLILLLAMVTLTSCYTTQYIYDDPVYDTETVYVDPEPVETYYYNDFNPYYRFRIITLYNSPHYGGYYWNTCSHFYHSNYYNHGCPQYYGYYNNYGYHNHTYWCGHGNGNCYNGYNGYVNNWNGYYGHRGGSFGHFRTSKPSRLALMNKEYKKPVRSLVKKQVLDIRKPVPNNVRIQTERQTPKRETQIKAPQRERVVIPATRERRVVTPNRVSPTRNSNRYNAPRQQPQRHQQSTTPSRQAPKAPSRPQTPIKTNSKKRGG